MSIPLFYRQNENLIKHHFFIKEYIILYHDFQKHLHQNHPEISGQNQTKILLALSGGRDSMLLCHLLLKAGISIGLAHCNFQLRGKESDEDQVFVQNFAASVDVPFYTTNFDTQKIADAQKLSIQVAARELRYEWLEKIRAENQYTYIATAHHLNDSLETLLYNLSKGTGIRGLHGIPASNGFIIRPLLFASRPQIEEYIRQEKIAYREDSSNENTKYQRNLIRKEVVPVLKKINPSLEKTFADNIARFQEVEWLYQYAVDQLKKEMLSVEGDHWTIDLQALKALPARQSILYEWLRPLGFHSDQIKQLFQFEKTSSGRLFFSATHELLEDRDRLLIRPIPDRQDGVIPIRENCESIVLPEGKLEIQLCDKAPLPFSTQLEIAYFQYSKLEFPLQLRRWKSGDRFQPFGMQGHHQKLQDFFNNAKMSRFEKEKVWILESGGNICWLVGQRSDERFRVEDTEGQVIMMKWILNI